MAVAALSVALHVLELGPLVQVLLLVLPHVTAQLVSDAVRAGLGAVLYLDGDAASAAQRRAVLADGLVDSGDDAVRIVLGLDLEPTIGAYNS